MMNNPQPMTKDELKAVVEYREKEANHNTSMRSYFGYFDKDGNSIDIHTFSKLHNDRSYVDLAKDTVKGNRFVSTVWLGIEHGYSGSKPLIFETMVFKSQSDFEALECERYATLEQALAGHKAIVLRWNKGKKKIIDITPFHE